MSGLISQGTQVERTPTMTADQLDANRVKEGLAKTENREAVEAQVQALVDECIASGMINNTELQYEEVDGERKLTQKSRSALAAYKQNQMSKVLWDAQKKEINDLKDAHEIAAYLRELTPADWADPKRGMISIKVNRADYALLILLKSLTGVKSIPKAIHTVGMERLKGMLDFRKG